MQSTWHRQVLLFVWVGVCFAAHTTLGLRLLCRSGMRVWVRMYTPEKEGQSWRTLPPLWWCSVTGNISTVVLLPQGGAACLSVCDCCDLRFLARVSPIVLVAKFFSNPSMFCSLLCTMHPALLIFCNKYKMQIRYIQGCTVRQSTSQEETIQTNTFRDGYCCLKLSANSQTLRVSAMSTIWTWTSLQGAMCKQSVFQ